MAELTHAQAQKVIAALQQRGDGDEVQRILEQRLEDDPKCPHCGSRRIEGWGRERNSLTRSRCLDCRRTFNSLTGTPLARLRKKERWLGFAGALNQSLSVRKAARACKVNKNTAFKWRHRFLKTQNQSKDLSLAGIAEVDEIFLLESFKGQRKLPRAARKRGGVAEKPGLSAEQIPVLIARDRAGAHIDAVLPDRSEAAVRPVLEGKLSKDDTLLCMDGDKALIAFAEAEGIEYELIMPAKVSMRTRRCCTSRTSMLWRALQAMAQPLQRRRHQISPATSAGGAGWKGRGNHNSTNRPRRSPRLKPTQNSDSAIKLH